MTRLDPFLGSVAGGLVVSVHGLDFSEAAVRTGLARCRFGDVLVPVSRFVSSELLECVTPAHAAGDVLVEVSSNAIDFFRRGEDWREPSRFGAKFMFQRMNLTDMNPKRGPAIGDTTVILFDQGFPLSSRVLCLLGGVPLTLDSTKVMCRSVHVQLLPDMRPQAHGI